MCQIVLFQYCTIAQTSTSQDTKDYRSGKETLTYTGFVEEAFSAVHIFSSLAVELMRKFQF